MADAESVALLKVKADTSQAVRETEKLTDAQKKLGREVGSTGASFTKFIDGAAVGLAKFNLAMGGIQQGLGMLKGGLDIAKEVNAMERLEKALPTGAIERLNKASSNLIDRSTQLRLATRAMTGDFALSETQFMRVEKAAVALAQRGYGEAADLTQKLLEQTIKFEQEGLGQLGIAFKKTGDRATDLNKLLGEFDQIVSSTGPVDERTKSLADMNKALEDAALAIKKVVAAAVNGIAELVKDLREYWPDFQRWIHGGDGSVTRSRDGESVVDFARRYDAAQGRGTVPGSGALGDWRYGAEMYYRARDYARTGRLGSPLAGAGIAGAAAFAGAYGGPQTIEGFEPEIIGRSNRGPGTEYIRNTPRPYGGPEGLGGGSAMDMSGFGISSLAGLNDSGRFSLSGAFGGPGGFGADRLKFGDDPMAKLRGKAGIAFKDFGLDVAADQIGAAASAMSSAMTAALEAAISGSEGIGKAARKASAQVLKALAVESAGRAVYEGALALGSLAIGNVASASTHGAAAAKFAIAAAVTGAGAAALGSGTGVFQGGGGGGAGAPAGGGFTRAPTAGQGGGGGTNITINFGDGFVGDQRAVADAVAKAVQDSQRRGGSRTGAVRFDG